MAALDDHIRDTLGRILDSLRGQIEAELASAQDELVRAAEESSARIAADASERATAEARESAARDAEEQRTRFTAEIEGLQSRMAEAQDNAQRQLDESQRRLDDSQKHIEERQREMTAARAEIDTLTNDLETARQELDSTRDDVEATLRDVETSRRDSDAVRREVSRLTDVLRGKDERIAQASRLPDAVRALDESETFGQVLELLAVRSGREAGRAAVFLVKGDRLRDWRTVGFDFASDASRLDIELSHSGLIAEAVNSRGSVRDRQGGSLPEFARTEDARDAAAWPVSVGGSVVAVLYADGRVADNSDEPYWPAFLDVLARHAGRVLEGITVRQAAGLMTGKASGMSASPVGRQSSGSIQ